MEISFLYLKIQLIILDDVLKGIFDWWCHQSMLIDSWKSKIWIDLKSIKTDANKLSHVSSSANSCLVGMAGSLLVKGGQPQEGSNQDHILIYYIKLNVF